MSSNEIVKAAKRELTGPDAVNHLHLLLLKEWNAVDELTKKARARRIRLGHLLLGLQQLIDSGENGDQCTFWEWFDDMVPRSRSDARDLMNTARQANPEIAHQKKLEKQKEYNDRYYRKKLGASEAERSPEITEPAPSPEIEPEFKPKPHYPSAEGDDGIIEQIINLFCRLSWDGCVRAIKRIGEEYKSWQAGQR